MTITPMDIQNKEFERSFRGYDIEDVDEFLDRVAKELLRLSRENEELKEQVSQLQEKNRNYQKLEETMHNAIVVAQETADEVKKNARHEADLIRREAEKEAQRIIEDARYRSSKIMTEQEDLFRQARIFKMRFRSFIEAQLASLESEDWMDEEGRGKPLEEAEPGYSPRSSYQPAPGPGEDYEPKPEVDIEPEPEPNPEPEPDFEATREFETEDDIKPRRDHDFGTDPDF